MKPAFSKWVFIVIAAAFCFLIFQAVKGLNKFGEYNGIYGVMLNKIAVTERAATNVVSTVAFDYRAVDTMGEEFILFASIAGISLLLRRRHIEEEEIPEEDLPGRTSPDTSDAVKVFGLMYPDFIFLFGTYMVLHAHLTPGGGFQGGVIIASAVILIYLASDYKRFSSIVSLKKLEKIETVGLSGFILTGIYAFFRGDSFLYNFLPYGVKGSYLSGGIILLLNIFVGLAVSGGIILLANEFLEQTILLRETRAIVRRGSKKK